MAELDIDDYPFASITEARSALDALIRETGLVFGILVAAAAVWTVAMIAIGRWLQKRGTYMQKGGKDGPPESKRPSRWRWM
jgi:hypothetical protein